MFAWLITIIALIIVVGNILFWGRYVRRSDEQLKRNPPPTKPNSYDDEDEDW